MRENKTCPYEGWQQLPTQELDQIFVLTDKEQQTYRCYYCEAQSR